MNNYLSTQNYNQEPYWVVMESTGENSRGMMHDIVLASNDYEAFIKAYTKHASDGWSCVYGGKVAQVMDQLNLVELLPDFCRANGMEAYYTVVEDRTTGKREGGIVVSDAKQPKRARRVVLREIRTRFEVSPHDDNGRFVILLIFESAELAGIIHGLRSKIEPPTSHLN